MDKVVDKLLRTVADEANKSTPARVDEITSIDSLGVAEPRALVYYYSVTLPKDSMMVDVLKESVLTSGKTAIMNPQLDPLRKADVTFRFIYFDVNGEQFCEVDITPEMYKAKEE
jgi:hypothetical protein